MKQLSSIKANDKTFVIQTEIIQTPSHQVRTLVYYTGKVLNKKLTPIPEGSDKETIDQMIETQHISVEEEVRERLNKLMQKKSQAE